MEYSDSVNNQSVVFCLLWNMDANLMDKNIWDCIHIWNMLLLPV